jgi:hypothetical protein
MSASIATVPFREVKLTSLEGFMQGRCRRFSKNGRSTFGPLGSDTACTSYRCRTSTDHCGRGRQPIPAAGGETVWPGMPSLVFLIATLRQLSCTNISALRVFRRTSRLQQNASVQADSPVRTHVHTGSTTTASFRIHLDRGLTQRNRLGRTNRLAGTARRTRGFIDARHWRCTAV